MKKIISLILAVLMLTPFLPVSYAEGTEDSIRIDKKYLALGDTLKVDNPSDFELKYFTGDDEIGSGTLTLTESLLEKWITVRAYDAGEEVASDSAYFSRLPVIYIDTDDGEPVTSKKVYKTGKMTVQSNDATENFEYDGVIQIKGRGNTSWAWPKKPYKIKLDKKTSLFGMGKNKHWVLISNYLDECFMRNKVAYDFSRELGLESMDSVWADVVINGEYAGNYLLCEQIRAGETRVNIYDWESEAEDVAKAIVKAQKKLGNILDQDALEDVMVSDLSWITTGTVDFEGATYETGKTYDDITGGYLFELSNEYDEISKFTTDRGLRVMINSPEYLSTNGQMTDYVTDLWQTFEDAYCSEDGYADTPNGRIHYTEIADVYSMAAYWLVMEIMGNIDAVYKSRYAYKGFDSLLKFGPVWDFDWGSGSSTVLQVATGWKISKSTNAQGFYRDWTDDPLFLVIATEEYWEARPYLENLIKDGGIIETYVDYLRESGEADGARWDRNVTWPDKGRGFESDAEIYLQFLRDRVAWLDKQFETDTMLWKSTYTYVNSYPYKKAENKISFSIPGSAPDNSALHAPADAVIKAGTDVTVNIGIKDAATSLVNVYVNGPLLGSYQPEGGKFTVTIPDDVMTAASGKKNVISVIGKNSDGESTYKSYYTVIRIEGGTEVICGGERYGIYAPDSEIALPVPDAVTESGAVRRFFTWRGAEVSVSAFDSENGTSNGRTYVLTVPDQDVELTPEYVLVGDVNDDGMITLVDVSEIKTFLASGGAGERGTEAADVNFDGLNTLSDLSVIKSMLAGSYTPIG